MTPLDPANNPSDRGIAQILLSAASKSGDPNAITLAAKLSNTEPCKSCGYVHYACRCHTVTTTPK